MVKWIRQLSEGIRWLPRKIFVALALVPSVGFAVMPASAAEKAATIRLWDVHIHDKKFRKQIFDEFNKANPDIKVVYTSQVGATYPTMLNAAFKNEDPPDIFVPAVASLAKLVEMGWVMPLDDVAPSSEELRKWMALFPQEQQPFVEGLDMFNGKVYSWPIGADGGKIMLFWNTKLFREAGLKGPDSGPSVPETWEDMRLCAKKITESGNGKVYGIVHGVKNSDVWDMDVFMSLAISSGWSYSGWGLNMRTGRYDFKHPGLRGSIQLWLDMKADGSIFPGDLSMDDEQAKFKFGQSLAGMIFGGPWVPGGLLVLDTSLEFDTVLPPVEKRGKREGYVSVGPSAGNNEYVVSSKARNREAVWRVITFMTSQQYQEGWVKAGGGISVFPQYNKPEFFPHPTVAKIAQMATTGRRTAPMFPLGSAKVWEFFDVGRPNYWDTMQGMWIGQLGWDAWDDLERRSNKAFDEALSKAQKAGVNLTRADYTWPDWDPAKNYGSTTGKK